MRRKTRAWVDIEEISVSARAFSFYKTREGMRFL
nr:MAG TPA: hypothetical protein [Caudoviricetes sp.]